MKQDFFIQNRPLFLPLTLITVIAGRGQMYVKQSELSREVFLRYTIQKGDVVPVTLFTVTVQNFGG